MWLVVKDKNFFSSGTACLIIVGHDLLLSKIQVLLFQIKNLTCKEGHPFPDGHNVMV